MKYLPYRLWIGFMLFWASAQTNIFLGHFQISLLAMISRNETESPGGHSAFEEDYGERYEWSKLQEGQLISAYFYGMTIMSIPGGLLSDRFGPFRMILVVTTMSALFTCISVPLVGQNMIPLFICRFFVGVFGCMKLPACNGLIARWSPPHEKGTFTSALLGYVFGGMVGPPLSSLVVESMGWKWSFYVIAISAIVMVLIWVLTVSDYPTDNWFCSKEEAKYIEESYGGAMRKKYLAPPMRQMLTSVPLYMEVLGHVGMISGFTTCTTLLPKFMSEALGYELRKLGIIAMLPSLARLITGFIFGIMVQIMLQKYNIDKKYPRKGLVLFSHFIPGALCIVFLLNYITLFNDVLVISIIVLSNACAASSVVTSSVNMQDLAPNYASTQNGLMSFFGYIPGFVYPSIVAKVTEQKSELPEWSLIFAMTGVVYIVTGALFVIFGSTELQPWNESPASAEQEQGPPEAT